MALSILVINVTHEQPWIKASGRRQIGDQALPQSKMYTAMTEVQ